MLDTALVARDALTALGMSPLVKTSGATPGPDHGGVSDRPAAPGGVLVDYNQKAWGRALASIYSVRPRRFAGVSTPVTWQEVEHGFEIEEFTLRNLPGRARRRGDLWKALLGMRGRFPRDRSGSTSPNGTASAASLSATGSRPGASCWTERS